MFSSSLSNIQTTIQKNMPAEDVLFFPFSLGNGHPCLVVYVDGITNKELLGELVKRPLSSYDGEATAEAVCRAIALPESKLSATMPEVYKELADGNGVLFLQGEKRAVVLGLRQTPVRAVSEPPTDVTVKGPRAGFTEDLKTNLSLLRTRIKAPSLTLKTVVVGKQSGTKVTVCYVDGVAQKAVAKGIEKRLSSLDVDNVADASVIALLLAERRYSFFKQSGTTEKPDVFAARLTEGRVGVLVDGSPIALTFPYLIVEDLQSSEDYFVSPFRATFLRLLRLFSLLLSVYLPAFYVAAQLYKIQLLPLDLLLTIAGGVRDLPLSPSLEMLYALLILEILTEAGIRMPKYVGLALSVVGALVLGDTAVNAGFLSTPAIMIVALSGICLYTVPDLVETTSLIRLLMLLFAGSIGTYGILLLTALLLYYVFSVESYGAPIFAPFSPTVGDDLKDALIKFNAVSHPFRPKVLKLKNKRRAKYEK